MSGSVENEKSLDFDLHSITTEIKEQIELFLKRLSKYLNLISLNLHSTFFCLLHFFIEKKKTLTHRNLQNSFVNEKVSSI